jgi:acetyl-CoA synthetase
MTGSPIIWRPSGDYLKSRVADFAKQSNIDTEDWRLLIQKSTNDIEWFWNSFLSFADMQWSKPYHTLLDQSKGLAWTEWFIGGETNIAYNCLDWHVNSNDSAIMAKDGARQKAGAEHLALIWENESGQSKQLSYGELNLLSGKIAALLKQLGVKRGDAVGIYMPMIPEVLAILFGCFKLGAIAVPVFSGFGAEALAKRMQDAQAKVIFTADGGKRRGKLLEIKKDVDLMRDSVPTLKHVVVVKYSENKVDWFENDIWFSEAINNLAPISTCYDLPSEHPCLYLYTSGTTGKPKGTIHTHAGALAQIAKELGLVFDVQKSDRFFWLTDVGWMMGPWEMIGVTYWGGTLVMYDGAPDFPGSENIWRFIAENQINTLGVSPTAIRILRPEIEHLISRYDFSSIKYLGSTGEPWDEENYMWFFNKIGSGRCPIMNISGGTELIGCLLTPLPTMPLPACSLGSKGLAMDVDVYDESASSLTNGIGHLVLKQPAPSLTRGFLGDEQRYLDTYFSHFKNIWYQGDWAKQTDDGYWFLYGRSDDTIKISGKRIGPGEIESALIEHPAVKEAAAIGVPDKIKGEVLVCFIVLNKDILASTQLKENIVTLTVENFGALARPKDLFFVSSLPKTRSGKIVRGAIRKKYIGDENIDTSSIENPEALQAITKGIIK